MKFNVRYFYLATGMEGSADERDFGIVEAESADDAKDIIAMREYPTDIMYGPNEAYSTRQFFLDCLSANPVP